MVAASPASIMGVLPPKTMFDSCGALRRLGTAFKSSRVSGASTKVISAPASGGEACVKKLRRGFHVPRSVAGGWRNSYLAMQRAHFVRQPLHRRVQPLHDSDEHRHVGAIIGPLGARTGKLGENPGLLLRQKI